MKDRGTGTPCSGTLSRILVFRALTGILVLAFAGCSAPGEGELRGHLSIDGSSTVYPIAEAASEEFQIRNSRVMVTLGRSGTGGGFERFCRGETDVATASRSIRDFEAQRCASEGVEYLEFPVALDGLSVIVNPGNIFVQCLSIPELREIWRPGSPIRTWRDLRPEFPAEEIRLYGPGTDSGTFDTFTQAVVGEMGESRMDFEASEDDNVLVRGLISDQYSLGYFGYSYLEKNRDALKVVSVDGGGGCVAPSPKSIEDGSYSPLGRQLYLYVKVAALNRPETQVFLEYFLSHGVELVSPTGLLPLSTGVYAEHLMMIRRLVDAMNLPGIGAKEGAAADD